MKTLSYFLFSFSLFSTLIAFSSSTIMIQIFFMLLSINFSVVASGLLVASKIALKVKSDVGVSNLNSGETWTGLHEKPLKEIKVGRML